MSEGRYRRVNVMILEDQYERLSQDGLNLSGLIRDLLGDYLSQSTVTIQVSDETRRIYDLVISNTDTTDEQLEVHLRDALAQVLGRNIEALQQVHKRLMDEQSQRAGGGSAP